MFVLALACKYPTVRKTLCVCFAGVTKTVLLQVTSGDSDSPVVVVRDLDNNQLVYAPSRAEFM